MSIFNVRGTTAQQSIIDKAVAATRFDPNLMLPGLKRATGKDQIDVYFRNLGSSIGGTASTAGVVEINTSLSDLAAQQVFVMEGYAHCTDFFYLTDVQRKAIFDLWHPVGPDGHSWFEPSSYWNQVGEALMDLFVWAFTPWETQNAFVHKPTRALADKLPAIYGGAPLPPPPPPPPPPVRHPSLDLILTGSVAGRGVTFRGTAMESAPAATGHPTLAVSLSGSVPYGPFGGTRLLALAGTAAPRSAVATDDTFDEREAVSPRQIAAIVIAGIIARKPWPEILKDVLAALAAP